MNQMKFTRKLFLEDLALQVPKGAKPIFGKVGKPSQFQDSLKKNEQPMKFRNRSNTILKVGEDIKMKLRWQKPQQDNIFKPKHSKLSDWYNQIADDNRMAAYCNMGPFNLYAIIDGHNKHGRAIAQFVKQILPEILFRNRDIMVYHNFERGMKFVFIHLEEILRTDHAQQKLRDLLGYPKARVGSMF